MAVDVCSASEVSITPRISFSHDINDPSSEIDSIQSDPIRSDQILLSPSFNFTFCTTSNLTPADELFSNGKIIPTQIQKPKNILNPVPESDISPSNSDKTQKKRLKELIFRNEEQEKSTSTSRSFWQFRRSTSLNCDNMGKGPKGLLRSLSIKSLSRSNSTGSALNPNRHVGPKVMEKPKEPVSLRRCSSLSQPPPSTHMYYSYHNSNGSRNSKGGIRIIPVLNVPPAYNISKGTINFFGFGSLLCSGKAKKKTKS